MSASRDHSQGIAFVYLEPHEVKRMVSRHPDQFFVEPPKKAKSINLPATPPKAKQEYTKTGFEEAQERAHAINQIKNNLDRLQALHHKLHDMMEDLNSITDSPKKRKKR